MMRIRRGMLTMALACLLGLALAGTTLGAQAPSHQFLFALEGGIKEPGKVAVPPPEGEFEDACGVAVDSAGDFYVSDYYHRTIDVYSPSREYLTQIPDPDPDGPCGLAVDAVGDVFVNNWRRDVIRYSPSEFPPGEATHYGSETVVDFPTATGARSTGIALDPQTGTLYVDDRTDIAVYETAALAEAEPHASRTLGLGLLDQGYGIAVSDFPATAGDIYVPDAITGTVLVLSPSGSLIAEVDGAGTPQRGFVSLLDSSVAVDPTDGHLFVADDTQPSLETPAAVVDEFNAVGDYRGQLPDTIVDAGPSALATDPGGNVYVTSGNSEGARLLGFGPTEPAHLLTVSSTGTGSGAVTSEPAGIDCGRACAAEFAAGEEVLLTAVPDPGSAFAGWSGCDHSTGSRCAMALTADRQAVAEFEPAPVSAALGMTPAVAAQALATASTAAPSSLLLRQEVGGERSVLLRVELPGAGTLRVRGRLLRPLHRRLSAGTHRLRVALNSAGTRALRRRGELAVRLEASFHPLLGGAPIISDIQIHYVARPRREGR